MAMDMDTIIFFPRNISSVSGRNKIAAFDLDFTLIHPKSNKKFPLDQNDWTWHFECVPRKLKELYNNGYEIIIFSNQNGIESGKQNKEDLLDKIKDMSTILQIPLKAYLSTSKNHFRKPSPKMWQLHIRNREIDYKNSFYVGDAAGRIKAWDGNKKTKKDFSCSDRKFAENCGLKFYTEREFFLEEKETDNWDWNSFDPSTYFYKKVKTIHVEGDVIIMVGCPASGKSSFAKTLSTSQNYKIINRDTLKTMKKCEKEMIKALQNNHKVIIDNTNPNKESRQLWINIAKKYNKIVNCCVMNVDKDLSKHLNIYREKQSNGKIKRIPDIVYNIFFKKYEEPTDEEFNKIYKIDFMPKFNTKEDQLLFEEFT